MQVHFPFTLDGRGRVAEASRDQHVRQLIEQVLFTAPGERVNRPEFGCGLLKQIFGTEDREERAATEFLVHQALGIWLGSLIEAKRVEITKLGEKLFVAVDYVDLQQRQPNRVTYEVSAL